MEAPRGALRLYNADELEPLSRAGLEALLMEIQDDYHRREGEDQLYLDATKPIRALLRKRRRESVGPSPPATQVIEAVDVPLSEAPNSAATTNESDDVVVGTPKFGKAKDMEGYEQGYEYLEAWKLWVPKSSRSAFPRRHQRRNAPKCASRLRM